MLKVYFAPDSTRALAYDLAGGAHQVALFPDTMPLLIGRLQEAQVPFAVWAERGEALSAVDAIALCAMFFPFVFLLTFLASTALGGGISMFDPFGIGRTSARLDEAETGITFADVAGCDASKLELSELVEFLKNPLKFAALGARIPRGALMEGPPGTGKTLLARAVAGEAGVPFISASGSEFVEMYVGVGAARVRDLFGKAKRHDGPCVIFIDEIDAVGKARSAGPSGGSGEREQTLNQILTEMDGFERNQGVIVLAATNRADLLDPALLRPGRFDRRVPVDLPDVQGRRAILAVHTRDKPLAHGMDLDLLAQRTVGFSGASLANLMNEAAIIAARNNASAISYGEVDDALDRLTVGQKRTGRVGFAWRQRLVAHHEVGHAVMALICDDYDSVTKVTIVPRSSGAGGLTLFTPAAERLESGLYSFRYLKDRLAVALGGRVAEELFFGDDEATTGAANDLQQVRSLARQMVAQWGFAFRALGGGPVAWEAEEGNGPLAPQAASDETEAAIDAEVTALVNEAYEKCVSSLTEHRALVEEMVGALLEKETLDHVEIDQMRARHLRLSPERDAARAVRRIGGRRAFGRRSGASQPAPNLKERKHGPMPTREPARLRRKEDASVHDDAFGI